MIDEALVRRLVDGQFPQWSDRALRLVDPAGSDHVTYRLGDDLSVRVPRHDGAIGQADKEACWLPSLAPHLPPIPEPVGVGRPEAVGEGQRLAERDERPAGDPRRRGRDGPPDRPGAVRLSAPQPRPDRANVLGTADVRANPRMLNPEDGPCRRSC